MFAEREAGKTTFPQATGVLLAKKGQEGSGVFGRSSGFSNRHFETDHFGKGPTEIMPNLYAQEIADRRVKDYQQEIPQKIFDMYGMDNSKTRSRAISRQQPQNRHEESAIFDQVWISSSRAGTTTDIYDWFPLGMRSTIEHDLGYDA